MTPVHDKVTPIYRVPHPRSNFAFQFILQIFACCQRNTCHIYMRLQFVVAFAEHMLCLDSFLCDVTNPYFEIQATDLVRAAVAEILSDLIVWSKTSLQAHASKVYSPRKCCGSVHSQQTLTTPSPKRGGATTQHYRYTYTSQAFLGVICMYVLNDRGVRALCYIQPHQQNRRVSDRIVASKRCLLDQFIRDSQVDFNGMTDDATFSRVELSVKCTELADMDLFSKSDPICVLFSRKQGDWVEEGRTEVIQDNLNPTVELLSIQ